MNIANDWKDYKILDMADGQKLEKWGNIILSRPDPQIITITIKLPLIKRGSIKNFGFCKVV